MRPVLGCSPRGSYRWQRTTLTTDTVSAESSDELFAKLPLGAADLQAELARTGRIAVQTTVGGQFVLEGSSAAEVPDYGDCAQATHLLTALSIGAFKLRSGGTLHAGGAVGVAEVGASASTSSAETLLREAGDPEACRLSTDEGADIGCSSPIQAFLQPLPRTTRERGKGTVHVTFSAGDSKRGWELRQNQQFVCRAPCSRWVDPAAGYEMRTESADAPESIELPDLRPYAPVGDLDVRAHPRAMGEFVTGLTLTGLGGMSIFFGGFFALIGAAAERDGFTVAGAVTAGVGAAMIAPGLFLIVDSAPRTEVTPAGGGPELGRGSPAVSPAPPRLGVHATF